MDQEDIRQIIRIQLTDAEIVVTELHLDIAIEYYNIHGSIPDIDYIIGRVVEQTMVPANNIDNNETVNNNDESETNANENSAPNNEIENDTNNDNANVNTNDNDNTNDNSNDNDNPEPLATAEFSLNNSRYPSSIIQNSNNTNGAILVQPQNIYFRIARRININMEQEELPELDNIMNNDEQLSELQNMIVKKVIENIDDIKLDIVKEKYNSNECIVCYDNFVETDLVRILDCKHMAHRRCIDNYLLKESHLCPMCKRPAGKYRLINM